MRRFVCLIGFLSAALLVSLPQPASADTFVACARASGNPAENENGLRVCTRAITNGRVKGQELARSLNNRGMVYTRMDDLDRALTDFNAALRIYPDYAYGYDSRGIVWQSKGDFDRALADFNAAIRIDRTFTGAYYNRGSVYEDMGNLKAARADYEAALAQKGTRAIDKWARDRAQERLKALGNR